MVWWILWIIFLLWIFVVPFNIFGQRTKAETPLNVLKKRFAKGEISKEEYEEKKKILELEE
jgi:putative membrane protein